MFRYHVLFSMASTSKTAAKQEINYSNMASGVSSNTEANAVVEPHLATNALTELQAMLEKAMQEMAQVSIILKSLQEDVPTIKMTQAKVSMDITATYKRLDEAE